MSFSKFLADVTVPTGGWDLNITDPGGTFDVEVAAGTHTFIGLLADLQTSWENQSDSGQGEITVVNGNVVLTDAGVAWSINWGDTDDALENLLGLKGDETHASGVITATYDHRNGWYPGLVTYGAGDGEGLMGDTGWQPVDMIGRSLSGSGEQSSVKPGRIPYERTLTFDMIGLDEGDDPYRGPKAFIDQWGTAVISWYEDRDDGTATAEGTQGDPDVDTSADYWRVDCMDCKISKSQKHFQYYMVALTFNGRPD